MPPITSSRHWSQYQCAQDWVTPYVPAIEMFHDLISKNVIT